MDNRLQLFVERQDSLNSFIEVDRFTDESINIVDSIQDVKNITKIFAPFTRAFHLPSSPTNDEIFGYYYNNQLGTYDARFKTRAILKIGGADYKVGHISMDNSTMINSSDATSYKVNFTDETVTLKDKLGDEKLNSLDYTSKIQLNNRLSTVVNGLRKGVYRNGSTEPGTYNADGTNPAYDDDGLVLYPDVIYAPIFTKGKAVPVPFSPNNLGPTSNDYEYCLAYFVNDGTDSIGTVPGDGITVKGLQDKYRPNIVDIRDYRPSVKVGTMLEMINDKYSLGFSKEFMNREELDQLYLWHNGKIQSDLQGSNAFSGGGVDTANIDNLYLSSFLQLGTTDVMEQYTADAAANPGNLYEPEHIVVDSNLRVFLNKGEYTGRIDAKVSLLVVSAAGVEIPMWQATKTNIQDDGVTQEGGTLFSKEDATTYDDTNGYEYWRDFRNTSNGQASLTFKIELMSSTPINTNTTISIESTFVFAYIGQGGANDIQRQYIIQQSEYQNVYTGDIIDLKSIAPDMKIIEFLSGLFKMFNLTYKSEEKGVTTVETIDEFYSDPNIVDVGEFVDLDGAIISRAMIYKDVTMMYNKSEDAMSGQYTPRENGELFPDIHKKLSSISNSTYGSSSTAEGDNLSVKSPFTCMMYERLYTSWSDEGWEDDYVPVFDADVNHSIPNAITDVVVGHSIDSNLKKKDIKNLLFYGKHVDITRNFESYIGDDGEENGMLGLLDENDENPEWGNSAGSQGRIVGLRQPGNVTYSHTLVIPNDSGEGSTQGGRGFAANMTYLVDQNGVPIGGGNLKTQWWNPSNIMASKFRRNGKYMNSDAKIQGLQFSNENTDEYEYKTKTNIAASGQPTIYPTTFVTSDWINGLYDTYYKSYLERLYDKSSRLYSVTAKLPDQLISSYKMNDVYRVGNKEFTINKANINLMNGESKLELLTHVPVPSDRAVINSGDALRIASGQLYDESIEFDLELIKITNNNFPHTVRIQSGAVNNDYEYVKTGLTELDYESIGSDIWALRGIITPQSGQTNWTRTTTLFAATPHTAYAVLEHDDGIVTNVSNTVSFYNPVDSTAPTHTMNVTPIDSQTANITIAATDNEGGSGIGNVKITSKVFAEPLVVQYDQSYNGDPRSFICNVTAGTLNTFRSFVTDKNGNDSTELVETVSIAIVDQEDPAEPVLSGDYSYDGYFHIDLDIVNIYDNVGVDLITIMKSTNGGAFVVLDTIDPGSSQDVQYEDDDVNDSGNYRYYVFATDAEGNNSTNSNFYDRQGDPENDL
tara:strand:- start:5333 stop:9127 length:3795 start_codon:yes stop_codon:yes gene_type:complete